MKLSKKNQGKIIFKLLLIAVITVISVGVVSFTAQAYDKVTLYYSSGEGTGEPTAIDVPSGKRYTFPTADDMGYIAPEGQEFDKWYVTMWGVVPIVDKNAHKDGKYAPGETLLIPSTLDSLNVTAQWKDRYYTVNFEMNGATWQEDSQRVKHGDTVKKPYAYPRKAGATFYAWYTDPSLTDESIYDFDNPTPVTSDMTLYAGWGDYVGAYVFDVNMNRWGTDAGFVKVDDKDWANVSSEFYPYGKNFSVSAKVNKPGYTFRGWSPTKSTIMPTGEIVSMDPQMNLRVEEGKTQIYFAMFEKYRITYDTRGGSEIKTAYVNDEGKAVKPEDPKFDASGVTFDNWYTDETFTEVFDFNKEVTQDTTIYARWKVDVRIAMYDREKKSEFSGGKVKFKDSDKYYAVHTEERLDGDKETIIALPDNGYRFVGWAKGSPEGVIVSTSPEYEFTVEPDSSYYAIFDKAAVYNYIDNGEIKGVSNYTIIDKNTMELTDGWYVLGKNISTDQRLTVKGKNVNLIIPDGVTFNVPKGITVTDDSGFNIWAQSSGESAGSLLINDVQAGFAGIGGENGSGGSVTIHGGTINVIGGKGGAAIGASFGKTGGTVTIKGGNVSAYSYEGNGIGDGGSAKEPGAKITLGWWSLSDSIFASSYGGEVTLASQFADKERTSVNEAGILVAKEGAVFSPQTLNDNSIIAGLTLIPYDMGGDSGEVPTPSNGDSTTGKNTGNIRPARTGDVGLGVLWIALAGGAAIAIFIVVFLNKKRSSEN